MAANTTNLYSEFAHNGGSYNHFQTQLNTALGSTKESLDSAIAELNQNPDSPASLANLQVSINNWSVTWNMTSTINRAVKDALQSIVQKV